MEYLSLCRELPITVNTSYIKKEFVQNLNNLYTLFGIDIHIQNNDILFMVKVVDNKATDFTRYGILKSASWYGRTKLNYTNKQFPNYIPLQYIESLKEGDTFIYPGTNFSVICRHQDLNHSRPFYNKTFEDAIKFFLNVL